MTTPTEPLIRFYSLAEGTPDVEPADPILDGTIPLRASRHCEPFLAANGFGWYVFPPMNFALIFDGEAFKWRPEGERDWRLLIGGASLPGLNESFKEKAPPDQADRGTLRFLGAILEPGMVQIWPALLVRTQPGWGILVRSPVNLPTPGYQVLEGFIETDWYFGPIPANVRVVKVDEPVIFRTSRPLFQVQALPIEAVRRGSTGAVFCRGLDSLTDDDWEAYRQTMAPSHEGIRGAYRKSVKRRALDARTSG